MKVSMVLMVLVGLTFLNCAIGLRSEPLGRRSMLTNLNDVQTRVARLLQATPQPDTNPTASTNATAVMPTPRTATHGVMSGNATASNGTAARTGLDKWQTIADYPTLPPEVPVVDTAGLGKRRQLLRTRSDCTQAELQRASMGFDMECLQPYDNRYFDNDWRRRFFVRPGRNFG